ncbi:hypothetical protein NDU88_005697 [Pleurodeles waltl]|uniref:Uncharacterized protein n=1 Tax=Pleurodeles waltl TaxID=8319 RepID=A0AAV7UJP7_PLEWA|nr:hypothetical protein NDU88_005697 [Pleurodeles waltl]
MSVRIDLVSSVREKMEASIPSILRLTTVISCSIRSIVAGGGRHPHPVGPCPSGPGRLSSVFGAEQAPSTEARGGFSRRPLSVPPSPILLQSQRSSEAGLPARPALTGPRRMPGCNTAPGAGLVVPVALRPRVSLSSNSLGLVAETFEALGSQGTSEGRWVGSADAVRPLPPPRVRLGTELWG